MQEADFQKLKNLAELFKRLNKKVKLLSLLRRAKYEYEQNNYEECQKSCEEILTTDPSNSIALRGLGCVMQSINNYEKAIEYYNRALLNSQNKEIEYTLIGSVYYIQDNLEEAIKYYNLAIDINDNYDPAYEGRNQSLLENHLKIVDLQDELIRRELNNSN